MRISSSKQNISWHSIAIECHCVALKCTGSLQIEFHATTKEDQAPCWPTRVVCRQGFLSAELQRVVLKAQDKVLVEQPGADIKYLQKDKFEVVIDPAQYEGLPEPSADAPLCLTLEFSLTLTEEKPWILSLPDVSDQTPLEARITLEKCRLISWPGDHAEDASSAEHATKGNEFSFAVAEVQDDSTPPSAPDTTVEQEESAPSSEQAQEQPQGEEEKPIHLDDELDALSDRDGEEEEEEEEDEEYEYEEDEEFSEEEAENLSYTVEELYKFRNLPECQEEPENLKNSTIPILKKNAKNDRDNNRRRNSKRGGGRRRKGRGGGGGGGDGRNRGPQVNLTEIKPLEKSENRWKPSALQEKEEDEAKTILKQMNSNLNKLAKENLDKISKKMIEGLIDNAEVLVGVIDLIYDKALEETKFCSLYAELCLRIQRAKTPYKDSFIQLLAKRARDVFETITSANIGVHADYTDEERKHLIKLRYLGNIEFICELYKRKLLKRQVPLFCASNLLKQTNDFISEDDSLEALCKMLTSLGALLEASEEQAVRAIFEQLSAKKEEKDLSSRIRFKILDLIDLRKARWGAAPPKRAPATPNKGSLHRSTSALKTGGGGSSLRNAMRGNKTNQSTGGVSRGEAWRDKKNTSQSFSVPAARPSSNKWRSTSTDSFPQSKSESEQTKEEEETAKEETSSKDTSTADFDKAAVDRSIKNLIEEYYELKDLEEAKECVKELKCPADYYFTLVQSIINSARKPLMIPEAAKLITYLHKNSVITDQHIDKAYDEVFASIEEDTEEFPNLPKFAGGLTGHLVSEGTRDLAFLKTINQISFDSPKSLVPIKFTGAALDVIFENEESQEEITRRLQEAGLTMPVVVNGASVDGEKLPRYVRNGTLVQALLATQ